MAGPISGIVLAGGKSKRMGQDKTQIQLESGLNLVEHAVDRLGQVVDEIIVVTAGSRLEIPNVCWATDLYEGAGPLGGIYAGLLACTWNHALVVGCDMPFLCLELLRHMIDLPRDYDVLLPSLSRGVEPLHAIYGKSCLEPAKALLEAREYCILDLYGKVRMRYIPEQEVARYDPEKRSFFNINTPDQLRQARSLSRLTLEQRKKSIASGTGARSSAG